MWIPIPKDDSLRKEYSCDGGMLITVHNPKAFSALKKPLLQQAGKTS
jgi:hypothetical protein